jgi:hypothetical protein
MNGFPHLHKLVIHGIRKFLILRRMKRDVIKDENIAMFQSQSFQKLIEEGVIVPPESKEPISFSRFEWEGEKSISETLDDLREDRV